MEVVQSESSSMVHTQKIKKSSRPKPYTTLEKIRAIGTKLQQVTIHGRFQPPLHINHGVYVSNALAIADHVRILITNPYGASAATIHAPHRSSEENNPFSYEERVEIFRSFFNAIGIPPERYSFAPFDITDDDAWQALDPAVPNLVNTYSRWSNEKLAKFRALDLPIIHSMIPKAIDVSGSTIRDILRSSRTRDEKRVLLIAAGYIKEAIPGLFAILQKRTQSI